MKPGFIYSFPPISSSDARVLILGSMPGPASLRAREYYAHPRNVFWRMMGELVGAGPDKPYAEREKILKDRGVAVWDVLQSCIRPGSSDSAISAEEPNDFMTFFSTHQNITHVGLNGGKAEACFRKYAMQYCPSNAIVVKLPSTSPAHRQNFAKKHVAWQAALPF